MTSISSKGRRTAPLAPITVISLAESRICPTPPSDCKSGFVPHALTRYNLPKNKHHHKIP